MKQILLCFKESFNYPTSKKEILIHIIDEKQGQCFVSKLVRLFAHTPAGFTQEAGIRCNPV